MPPPPTVSWSRRHSFEGFCVRLGLPSVVVQPCLHRGKAASKRLGEHGWVWGPRFAGEESRPEDAQTRRVVVLHPLREALFRAGRVAHGHVRANLVVEVIAPFRKRDRELTKEPV